jgi:serine/threonine protein kinase
MIGVRLGPWLIDAELGRGGMGAVYRARRVAAGDGPEQAAIKVLAAELALEIGFRQRFDREINILRQLEHPHIVRFYEAGDQGGRYYFVMEYVAGPTFDEILDSSGRLPWRDVLDLALQIAPALKHAHDRGVIHRDLKPSNLLRAHGLTTGPGLVKLADFGIASLFASPHLTVTGGVIGTPEYLSPEQAAGKPVTPRSDLYALGIVLYQLLAGRVPFEGTSVELLHKHRYAQFEKLSRLVPELPHDIEEVIHDLLEKDPAKRPPDAGVLTRRFDRIRRKLDRKAEAASQAPTRTEADLSPEEMDEIRIGPATLMSRLMRRTLTEEKEGGKTARFLNRPVVLVLLLLLTVGLIVWGVWPVGPEELFQRGASLMASENPEDWEHAWDRYLSRLEENYPDHRHREEVEAFRRQYDLARAERLAKNAARMARAQSEAEWFYYKGLRLRRRGDEEGARKVWRALAEAFADSSNDRAWAARARKELEQPPPGAEEKQQQWTSSRDAVHRAAKLREQGDAEEAKRIRSALDTLYQDDPSAEAEINK